MSEKLTVSGTKVELSKAPLIDKSNILNVYLVYGPKREDSIFFYIEYQSEEYIKSLKVINTFTGEIECPCKKVVYNSKEGASIATYFITIDSPEHLILSIVDLRLLMDINYRLQKNYKCKNSNVGDSYKEVMKKVIKTNLMKLVNKFKATRRDEIEDYSVLYTMESPGVVDYIYESSNRIERSKLLQVLSNQNLLLKELI